MVAKPSQRGFIEWFAQRITAILIGIYAICITLYLFLNQPLYFAQWKALFQSPTVKGATLIILASILWHAWIGLWTVLTDYVKAKAVRLTLEVIIVLLLVSYFVWMIEILWT